MPLVRVVVRGLVHRFRLDRVETFCGQLEVLYVVPGLLLRLALVVVHRLLVQLPALRVQHVVVPKVTLLRLLSLSLEIYIQPRRIVHIGLDLLSLVGDRVRIVLL